MAQAAAMVWLQLRAPKDDGRRVSVIGSASCVAPERLLWSRWKVEPYQWCCQEIGQGVDAKIA